jgi:UrcA family protein
MPLLAFDPSRRPGFTFATLLAVSTLFLALADAALAAPVTEATRSVVLRADKNPRTPGQARALLRKIGNAAEKACSGPDENLPFYRVAIRRSDCWREAVARTVEQIGNPVLAQAHQIDPKYRRA